MVDKQSRTKILCTLGPSSDSEQAIAQLIEAGADGFRLNFSHGNHEYYRTLIAMIRQAAKKMNRPIAILQDLQGPKIRVGTLADGKPVHLVPGAKFILTSRAVEGNDQIASTTYPDLPKDVKPGDTILIADGTIELRVLRSTPEDVETEIITGGMLQEKKGINLPGTNVSAPSLTNKDRADARFGIDLNVDFIALSFVRKASDISQLKELVREHHQSQIHVIAKIEKPEAVENVDEILEVADGVMVARGDLGVEMPAAKIPLIQKLIIERANKNEKLVITATEMLESMVTSIRPTRAEASDVANAILDGTDVLMLSQETAVGVHPVRVVKAMSSIALYTESDCQVFQYAAKIRPETLTNFTHAIVHSARAAADVMKAKAILVYTQSGLTAQLASCQRPECPIYAFTPQEKTYNQLSLSWGVYPLLLQATSLEEMIKAGEELLLQKKLVEKGDVVVIITGTQPVRGSTNTMKIEHIGE